MGDREVDLRAHPGRCGSTGHFGVGAGETFVFELNLGDPDVLAYVRNGLNAGVLGFAITSMHQAEEQAGGTNPNFYTRDNIDAAANPPRMELIVSLPEPGVAVALTAGAALLGAIGIRRKRTHSAPRRPAALRSMC